MQHPEYSVVIPVYNSQDSLEELFYEIKKVFTELSTSFEAIFVDDGSKDQSWEILQGLQQSNQGQVRIIKLARNFGQHNATLCGLTMTRGEKIITTDDDLQWPPSEIPKLIQAFKKSDADIIYGIPSSDKKHSGLRNSGSKILKSTSRKFRDTPGDGSSFRIMKREIAEKICEHRLHFIFIDEIILWYTEAVGFVSVEHHKRKHQKSGYTLSKLLGLTANLVVFYTGFPLKVLVYGGFFASFISFVFGVIYIIKKIFWDVPLGYTSMITAILFSTSIILFSLGIIGEYLRRMYVVQNRKPPYNIRRIIE
ncbi:MAG: glycosyltransferase family 2 protein [Bacteroidales bacterium]|nr:glycosyltransferase family 2 protein [Bacteroidales bacterium]